MRSELSLRTRLLLGTVLWTLGLFVVTGIVTTELMLRFPTTPRLLHSMFEHAVLSPAIAVACMFAGLWQFRRAVASFGRLRDELGAVRAGASRQIGGSYPIEVRPVVDDLNGLLEHQARAVAGAQAKAGDLAHGLKTPLAVLVREAERVSHAGHRDLALAIDAQVDRMRRQVDFHLARARAAASGATPGARSAVLESAEGLARALDRLHNDRGVSLELKIAGEHTVRTERQDLDEMLGNLLDNACKFARTRVILESTRRNGVIVMTVDDDGPGIDRTLLEAVLLRGVRADEASPGTGFGLAIVRDLAELYGGSIALERTPVGGLRAVLQLPAA
jgi:signal transduction histidine kinase